MKGNLPPATSMIAELVFVAAAFVIIIGAFSGRFAGNPLLSVFSLVVLCLSIFFWARFQDARQEDPGR